MAKKKTTQGKPGIFERITESAEHLKDNISAATSAVVETAGEKYEERKKPLSLTLLKKYSLQSSV